jgi:hypothetical protein
MNQQSKRLGNSENIAHTEETYLMPTIQSVIQHALAANVHQVHIYHRNNSSDSDGYS